MMWAYWGILAASFALGFVLVVVAGQGIADRQARREDEARAREAANDWTPAFVLGPIGSHMGGTGRGIPIYQDDRFDPIAYAPPYLPDQQYDEVLDKHRLRQPECRPLWPDDELRQAECERSDP